MRILTLAILTAATCLPAMAQRNYIEADSAAAIQSRTRADFPYTVDEFTSIARQANPGLSKKDINKMIKSRIIETMTIDDTLRVFRKALRNMPLLQAKADGSAPHRGSGASLKRISYVDSVINAANGQNPLGAGHRVIYNFSVDVPVTQDLIGDTIRVWMPLPMVTRRQPDVFIIDSYPSEYITSDGQSVHNTVFFEAPVNTAIGSTMHFEYTGAFDTFGEFFPEEYILENIKPYNTNSEEYKKYTAFEAPHIIQLDKLAKSIIKNETNPFRISEKVYDYIINNYPWAGAREYSTIDCIPSYVINEGHGDCGQVALLYISLMRTLGIPARWESGWMLHPGEKNLHDWAEVYFEGIGWVPVDVSFGRYKSSTEVLKPEITSFYSHGMDAHRFAANSGVCGEFFPKKRFVRSETVDAQLGEVECTKGNLFYPAWDSTLKLISITPIKRNNSK